MPTARDLVQTMINVGRLLLRPWTGMQRFVVLLCVSLLLVVSCGPKPSADGPSAVNNGDFITIGTTSKLRTLDPADAYDIFSGILLNNMGERLYTYELGSTKLVPQLATALPEVSEDGLTYIIPLREGVQFHDGTPFNAKAMAFSLRRFIENGGQPSFLLADAIESVKPTAEYELTIELKQPFSALPALLSFFGACAVSPKAYDVGPGKFAPDTFVGTGPYKLARYGPDLLQLQAFDQYWGEKPANPGVSIQLLTDAPNLFNAFQTGAVDVAYQNLEPEQVQNLRQDADKSGWKVIEAQGTGVTYLVLNLKQEPLDNVAVRRAIAAIVDRPLINKRVYQGQAEPIYSLLPTAFESYSPVFKESYGDGNAEVAQKYLDEAGYSTENPLRLELWYPSNSVPRSLIASLLKAFAKDKLDGAVELEINSVDSATAFQNVSKGIYPSLLVTWFPDFFDPDTYIQPFLSCLKGSQEEGCEEGASQSQGSFYYSDDANALVKQQRRTLDPEKRQAIFGELQEILADDVPYIPLVQSKEYAFAQQNIEGVQISPTQQFPFWTLQRDTAQAQEN
ncbi:ABC transporter substrate-binding protein [Acaryochloris thomasi]|nr:ABC transporter substrate-binding protein [Acaryochloris thomasi]